MSYAVLSDRTGSLAFGQGVQGSTSLENLVTDFLSDTSEGRGVRFQGVLELVL